MPPFRRFIPKDTSALALWYQRYISPLFLIIGFLIDNFVLLKRVDFLQTHVILGLHLIITFVGILFENGVSAGKIRAPWALQVYPFVPVVIQFSFGALLAGYMSLYSRSADLTLTWITVAIFAILLISNEKFYKFYTKFSFQVSLYFLALLSYLIFALPILFKTIRCIPLY